MKNLFYILLLIVLVSCQKKYSYIEMKIDESGSISKEEKIFRCKNDSIAYFEGVYEFYKSLYAWNTVDLKFKKLGSEGMKTEKPYLFEVWDLNNKKQLHSFDFQNSTEVESSIIKSIEKACKK